MIILAIDTSGPVAGVSVWCDGAIRYEAAAVNKMTHSENIMPMVEEALLRAGVTKEQLTLLAVTVGPGSFTGVRIGVTAVKALSHALGIPCVAVDALEATAAGLEAQDEIVFRMRACSRCTARRSAMASACWTIACSSSLNIWIRSARWASAFSLPATA